MQQFTFDNLYIRPRFHFEAPCKAEDLLNSLKENLKKEGSACSGYVALQHVVLKIPYEDQHYWSPQMGFSIEEEKGKTIVRGLVGPMPAVWTLFVFIYAFIGFTGGFASIHGLSKWSLGDYTIYLWALPLTIMLMATAYIAGKAGQKLGKDQIRILRDYLVSHIEACEGVVAIKEEQA